MKSKHNHKQGQGRGAAREGEGESGKNTLNVCNRSEQGDTQQVSGFGFLANMITETVDVSTEIC